MGSYNPTWPREKATKGTAISKVDKLHPKLHFDGNRRFFFPRPLDCSFITEQTVHEKHWQHLGASRVSLLSASVCLCEFENGSCRDSAKERTAGPGIFRRYLPEKTKKWAIERAQEIYTFIEATAACLVSRLCLRVSETTGEKQAARAERKEQQGQFTGR